MKSILYSAVLVLLCTNMEQLVSGSALPNQIPDGKSDASPDLTSILGLFNGGLNVHTVLKYIQEFRIVGKLLVTLMNESPPLKNVVEATSKKNAKFRVLMKTAEGKFPDLKDIYQVATENKQSMYKALKQAVSTNKHWKEFNEAFLKGNFLSSYDQLSRVISLFTGGEVNLKPSVVKDLADGNYTVQSNTGQYEDVVRIFLFLNDNMPSLREALHLVLTDPSNYTGLANIISNLDISHFPGLSTSKTALNGKYTVVGGSAARPDVAKILEDYQQLRTLTASNAKQSDVQACIFSIVDELMKIFGNAGAKAEASGRPTKSTKPDQPSGVVG